MARLTLDQIARDNENIEPSSTHSLHLSHRALSDVSCLDSFKNLERLDLCFNCLSSLEDLTSCTSLKWLSVVENKLESLKGIDRLTNLMVFNAGKNKLRKIDEISSVPSLRALILNDNEISSICKLDQLKYLNTLVLSKNPIYDIGDSLMKVKSLTKLSLSHCHLEKIGSSLTSCVELKELRLAHNKIATISTELARNSRLLNLDMGNNLIENWSELKVLSALHNLRNLNLQGNPIAGKEKLVKKVNQLVPNLRIFNAKPMETSKKSKKFSKEDTSSNKNKKISEDGTLSKIDPPLRNASDVEAEKEVKRKKPKTDHNTRSNEEIHDFPSLTNDEVGKKSKRKKMEKGTPVKRISNQKKNDVTDATSLRTWKKPKSMEFASEEFSSFADINDSEAPSFDQIRDDKISRNINREMKDDRVVKIIEHEKKKKAKSTDLPALQILTSNSEVGLGGPSTWDD